MFGKKKPVLSEEVETVVGQETTVKGSISAKGSVRVDGTLEGELETKATAVIGQNGKAMAQITAANATIAGFVKGNVSVSGRLELLPTAKLYGDIKVGALIIGEGAVFKGACQMLNNIEESPQKGDNNKRSGK
ncbi:MAG: polymer-forming cytoskeletal protein [Veillonellaceae bacterium]|jgi:cytoskeletal protein CcmA (bactofilin family)|nr:polymer-forming cytoskeletal protein [Veillonellaceae bacterium]